MYSRSKETKAFLVAHVGLLAIVLVGFGRTFYLRALFTARPLPTLLLLHGIALTLWFALAVLQGALAMKEQRKWHGRIAWLAIPVVLATVCSGIAVNLRLAIQIESASSPENMFVWANFMSLASFVILVAAGVARRRDYAAHHRLMLFASLAIIGPAFARFAFWPAVGLGLSFAPLFAVAGMLLLILLAIGYDVLTSRRVQPATLAGVAGVLIPLVGGTAVAVTGLGFRLLH
jgi:uncharacterized membrane protein YozB (DUF420 family)